MVAGPAYKPWTGQSRTHVVAIDDVGHETPLCTRVKAYNLNSRAVTPWQMPSCLYCAAAARKIPATRLDRNGEILLPIRQRSSGSGEAVPPLTTRMTPCAQHKQ